MHPDPDPDPDPDPSHIFMQDISFPSKLKFLTQAELFPLR